MNPSLRSMLVIVGVIALGGVSFVLSTPQPATRTMAELRDAGIASGQKLVVICPEKLTAQVKRRVKANQPGYLRPKQQYGYVARVAVCMSADGGNCFVPATGAARVDDGEIIIPSLRANLVDVDLDAGEDDEVDDGWQYDLTACRYEMCGSFDSGVPKWANFCALLNRVALTDPPTSIPNCWVGDGGAWVDDAVVDCKRLEVPMGGGAAVPRWSGCNAAPRELLQGPDCVPYEGNVVAGESPWLEGY